MAPQNDLIKTDTHGQAPGNPGDFFEDKVDLVDEPIDRCSDFPCFGPTIAQAGLDPVVKVAGSRSATNKLRVRLITFVTDRPGHDARYAIDPTRIRAELGWRPSVTVEDGRRRTVRWPLDNEAWWHALQDRAGVGKR